MASVFLAAAAVTVVPALGMLFYLLRRYEGYFEDARVFFSLVVGFFAGLVVAFLQNILFQFDSAAFQEAAGAAFAFSYFVAGYAALQALAQTAVVGMRKFRRRKDTPYYGAALGIGFGMMLALQGVALAFERGGLLEGRPTAAEAVAIVLLVGLAAGQVMACGAAGVWTGRGSAGGALWKGLAHATAVLIPVQVALWFSPAPGTGVAIVPALAAVAYGLFILTYTQRKVLDTIVPPEIRDQVLKERRREQRKDMR